MEQLGFATYCFQTTCCANRLCCLNSESLCSHQWGQVCGNLLPRCPEGGLKPPFLALADSSSWLIFHGLVLLMLDSYRTLFSREKIVDEELLMKSWRFFTTFTYLLVSDIFPALFLSDLYTKTLSVFSFWQITVKALGCELRKEEMRRIISEFSEEGSGKLNFKSFLQVMTQKMVCEPSWSSRVKFLSPNFTMQVATADWVTLVPCRGVFQEFI